MRKTEPVSGTDAVSDSERSFIAGHFVKAPFCKPFILSARACETCLLRVEGSKKRSTRTVRALVSQRLQS